MMALVVWIISCTEREFVEETSIHESIFLQAYEAFSTTGECPDDALWSGVGSVRYWSDVNISIDINTQHSSMTSVAVTDSFNFNCWGDAVEDFDLRPSSEGFFFSWPHALIADGPVMQMGDVGPMPRDFEPGGDVPGWLCIDSFEPIEGVTPGPGVATGSFEVLVSEDDVVFGTFSSAQCITAEDGGGWQCDGLDNDADGIIDEGARDRNGNGVPDCQEE